MSDKKIYQAIIDVKKNIKITREDNINKCPLSEPCLTCCNLLKAVLTINKYTEEINDPFAHNIEALLGILKR